MQGLKTTLSCSYSFNILIQNTTQTSISLPHIFPLEYYSRVTFFFQVRIFDIRPIIAKHYMHFPLIACFFTSLNTF